MEGVVRHQLDALRMNLTSFQTLGSLAPADGAAGNVNLVVNGDGAQNAGNGGAPANPVIGAGEGASD